MKTNLRERLSTIIHEDDIHEICFLTQGDENNNRKAELYRLLFDTDKRVADNAAWIFTHFNRYDNQWLYSKHNELAEEAMRTSSETKRRLLLTLLLRQPFSSETIRTDFLDFCLYRMASADTLAGIRSVCMKLAYGRCRFFPELLLELQTALEMLEPEYLSPALQNCRKKILHQIKKKI